LLAVVLAVLRFGTVPGVVGTIALISAAVHLTGVRRAIRKHLHHRPCYGKGIGVEQEKNN